MGCYAIYCDKNSNEHLFIKSFFEPLENSVVKDVKDLREKLLPGEMVLADDTRAFPVVFIDKHPERFVLPYQYEYETVLSSPQLFVRYVVAYLGTPLGGVSDRIAGRYPEVVYEKLKGFAFSGRFGDFVLFQRIE